MKEKEKCQTAPQMCYDSAAKIIAVVNRKPIVLFLSF